MVYKLLDLSQEIMAQEDTEVFRILDSIKVCETCKGILNNGKEHTQDDCNNRITAEVVDG